MKNGMKQKKTPRTSSIRSFGRSLPMVMLRAREAVMRHFRASLNRHDVTEQQWRVLRALSSVGSIEVTALADLTFLHGPSLTRILRDLEKRRLVKRRPAPHDGRIGIISIAHDGKSIIAAVAPHSEAIYAEMASRFGVKDLARLEKMLTRLETALAEGPVIGGET